MNTEKSTTEAESALAASSTRVPNATQTFELMSYPRILRLAAPPTSGASARVLDFDRGRELQCTRELGARRVDKVDLNDLRSGTDWTHSVQGRWKGCNRLARAGVAPVNTGIGVGVATATAALTVAVTDPEVLFLEYASVA